MSKTKSSQKKVSLSELNNHTTTNKRQALKDLNKLDFDELMYKNPAQRRFYKTISDLLVVVKHIYLYIELEES